MTVKPLGWRVLIKRKEPEETTSGGIILHDTTVSQEHAAEVRGVIVGVGPEAWADMDPKPCKVGDQVMFRKYGGVSVDPLDRYSDILVQDLDVLAKIEG